MKKDKVITPDEIEFVDGEHGQHGDAHSFNVNLEGVQRFCSQRPWIRIFALLLLGISTLVSMVVLFYVLATFCMSAFGLFKNKVLNSKLKAGWGVFCVSMASLVACFVGIFSPAFGFGILSLYIAHFRPLPIFTAWIQPDE